VINYWQILTTNFSDKNWSIEGNSYEGIAWSDSSPKPTEEELNNFWTQTQEVIAKKACQIKAKQLIANCDWSVLPDVNISNKSEFETYRATLRNYIVNPVSDPVFPTEPQPIWG
jgi:hypothetical protein